MLKSTQTVSEPVEDELEIEKPDEFITDAQIATRGGDIGTSGML